MKYLEEGKGRAGGRMRTVRHSPPGVKLKRAPKKKKNQPVIKMNSILMQLILKSKLKLSPKIHEEQTFTILNKDRIKL